MRRSLILLLISITVYFQNGDWKKFRNACSYQWGDKLIQVRNCDEEIIAMCSSENVNYVEPDRPMVEKE